MKRLEQAEAATSAVLSTAPWSSDKDSSMLRDRNHKPLLFHIAHSCAWAWSSDFDPAIAPEVVSYLVAMNPAAMMPLLQSMREIMTAHASQEEQPMPEGPFISAAQGEALCHQALETWGADSQINQFMEEAGEAAAALNRYRRGRGTDLEAAEEIADVAIMVDQMKIFLGPDLVESIKQQKLERLQRTLNSHAEAKELIVRPDGTSTSGLCSYGDDSVIMFRIGKKHAGRLLDGREWNEIPEGK